jgi:hypothetical protein
MDDRRPFAQDRARMPPAARSLPLLLPTAIAAASALALSSIAAGCTRVFDRSLIAMSDAGLDADLEDGDAGPDVGDAGLGDGDTGPDVGDADRADGSSGVCAPTLLGRTTIAPPVAPWRPSRGVRTVDATFGTCITRISDARMDAEARTVPPRGGVDPLDRAGLLGPGGSVALLSTGDYGYYRYDVDRPGDGVFAGVYVGAVLGFDDDETLVLLDRGEMPYELGTYSLSDGSFDGVVLEPPLIPSELATASNVRRVTRSLSADGRRSLVFFEGPDELLVLGTATASPLGRWDASAFADRLAPSGARIVQMTASAITVRDVATGTFEVVPTSGSTLGSADVVRLADGHDGLALVDRHFLVMFDIEAEPTEIARISLLPSGVVESLDVTVSIDGSAFGRPGWLVVSFGPCTGEATPCSRDDAWARDKITLIGIAPVPVIHDVAWHRSSTSVEAVPSRDLSRILFVSDWGGGTPAEAYTIEIPSEMLETL